MTESSRAVVAVPVTAMATATSHIIGPQFT